MCERAMRLARNAGTADGLWNEIELEVLMHSRLRVPEEPLGEPVRRRIVTARGSDAELAAIALLCLVFAWPAEEREQPQPRPTAR